MTLTAEAQSLLSRAYRSGAPRLHMLSVEQARHSFSRLLLRHAHPVPENISVSDISMPRADAPALLARLYRPGNHDHETDLPALIWFHGGGWCLGDVDSYDPFCRQLADLSGCVVISVEYRLAPEFPFPAAIEDARFAFEWISDQAGILNIDPTRIALGGDSAGATLSIVTALDSDNTPSPVFLLLIYPCTDVTSNRPSRQAYTDGYFLDVETLHWFFDHYIPDAHKNDWRISPLHAPALTTLPPALMITAEYDPLLDDCIAFRERVQSEGGEIEYHCVPGMIHGFMTFGTLFPEAEATLKQVAGTLRARLQPPGKLPP